MSFCFYKSYQRICRQHLYINIKYIPMKKTTTYFNTVQWKHNGIVRLHHNVSISLHHPLLWYDLHFSLALNCKILSDRPVPHSYSLPHLFFFTWHSVTNIFFFIIFQTLSMRFMSGKFPGHSRMGILYHSRNVLILFRVMAWREIMYKDLSLL